MYEYKIIRRQGTGQEKARAKLDSVEEDHGLGPILIVELWSHDFTEEIKVAGKKTAAEKTYIHLEIYKYRVWMHRYDVADVPWELYGEASHSVSVETPRVAIERKLQTEDTDIIAKSLAKTFNGPYAVDQFIAFLREIGWSLTIHEDGPVSDDLVRLFYKTPLGDIAQAL